MASKHSTKISWNNCEIRNLHRYKDLPIRMLQIFYGIISKVHHVILCICQVWINPITLVIIYFFCIELYKQTDGRTDRQRDLPVTSSTTANATNNSSNINNICSKCKEKKKQQLEWQYWYRAAEEFVVIPALLVGMFSILIDTKTDKS